MALSQEQLDKYGLKIVEGGKESDGVFNSGGTYYQIEGFERDQQEGQDADKGHVFSSSLEADSGKSFTNFNTINDVRSAVNGLTGNNPAPSGPIEYSPELQAAHDRTNEYIKNITSGKYSQDIFGNQGPGSSPISEGGFDDADRQQKQAAQVFADGFIDNVKRDIRASLEEGISV